MASGVTGKYYFAPAKGFDKLYAGAYFSRGEIKYTGVGLRSNEVFSNVFEAFGLAVGYKWVLSRNFVFDFSTGIGKKIRNTYENIGNSNFNLDNVKPSDLDYVLRLGIGYRFSVNQKE